MESVKADVWVELMLLTDVNGSRMVVERARVAPVPLAQPVPQSTPTVETQIYSCPVSKQQLVTWARLPYSNPLPDR